MNKKVAQALIEQVNKEFFSAYLYLAMEQHLENDGMSGMANWMHQQFLEEQFHANKMMKYLNSRGEKVVLEALERPKTEWASVAELFKDVLEHEQFITASINEIQKIAVAEHDFASIGFLQWFIGEQVEEEENAEDLIKQVTLIGDHGYGLLMLDKEMATRTFVEPAPAE